MTTSTLNPVTRSEPAIRLRTVLAELRAVRMEQDGSIRLRLRHLTGSGASSTVVFPAPAMSHESIAVWAELARQQFLRQVFTPSFEGWTLLHGSARLRLLDDADGTGGTRSVVLYFDAWPDADED
jgi:hypothetical protein